MKTKIIKLYKWFALTLVWITVFIIVYAWGTFVLTGTAEFLLVENVERLLVLTIGTFIIFFPLIPFDLL